MNAHVDFHRRRLRVELVTDMTLVFDQTLSGNNEMYFLKSCIKKYCSYSRDKRNKRCRQKLSDNLKCI